jgi:hypothetical protein
MATVSAVTASMTPETPASGVHRIEDARDSAALQARPGEEVPMSLVLEQVTLIVYGWKNVEPVTLSWVFPSVGAALTAAHAMTNAAKWAIVAGSLPRHRGAGDVATARASGTVLAER